MLSRTAAALVALVAFFFCTGAKWNTRNFTVEAPTEQLAERMGQWAEYYRKTKAIEWLGSEMPPWPYRCPLIIKATLGSSAGATSFNYIRGHYLPISMEVEGKMDRIVASVLPHEVTHTVMAHYFRCPVPRWADEGGSVLSEDEQERQQHEGEVRRIVRSHRKIPLGRLFNLRQYPSDMIVLYAEGYSVTSMLVAKGGRKKFLAFVADGMRSNNWDRALQSNYEIAGVNALEAEWLRVLARPPASSTELLADSRTKPAPSASTATSASSTRIVVRRTLPPAVPLLGNPRVSGSSALVRGAMPEERTSSKDVAGRAAAPASGASPAGVRLGTPRVTPPDFGFARE
jgi:hypothetical protein